MTQQRLQRTTSHKARAGHVAFYKKFPGKVRLCQKNSQDLVKDFSVPCTPIPTLSLSCHYLCKLGIYFLEGKFGQLVFLMMTKTLANPLRRPPVHLMGSRSQIRVTTQGEKTKKCQIWSQQEGKKDPSVAEVVGEHREKGVAEPVSSFWDAGRRGEAFSCRESAQ